MGKIVVDDHLLTLLEADARSHGVMVDARAAQILREALEPTARRLSWRREADRIAALTPRGIDQTPAENILREDRDR